MARFGAALLLFVSFVLLLTAPREASAVVQGHPSSLHHFTVRLVGGAYCTGVVIGRRLVATAAHCGRGVSVSFCRPLLFHRECEQERNPRRRPQG